MCIVLNSGMAWMIAQWTLSQHLVDASEIKLWCTRFQLNYLVLKQVVLILNHLKPLLYLAPEGIKISISGPRQKKVVHH